MTHSASGRSGPSGNKADHRLLKIRADPCRRFFFGSATDLTDHYDGIRLIIVREEFDGIDEARSDDRIATDTDRGRLTEPNVRELLYRFVRQRARARDNTHSSL